jgi:plastocyanin
MSAPPKAPVKTLRAAGPAIVVVLILAAVFLGYFQIVYYPSIAPTSATTTTSTTSTGPSEKVVTITIPAGAQDPNTPSSQTYLPNVAVVYIGYNASVTWVNNDSTVHTVTAAGTPPDPKFSSFGPPSPYNNVWYAGSGQAPLSVNFTFTVAGVYNYSCSYHPWMKGSVIVKPALANLTASLTSSTTSSTTSNSSSTSLSNSSSSATSAAAILPGIQSGAPARDFASNLATLIGSGIAPWSVNLSNNLFELTSSIPAVLTKTA